MNTKETCGGVVIAGAGPAGLSAAYHLAGHGVTSVVLEQSQACGGLSRTEEYHGYRFDIGGHRFFTHVSLIARMWREILGEEFLVRPRLSRIYHRGRFFRYPLEPFDALVQLGPVEAILCLASYVRSQLFPPASQQDLESWLIARFGSRLYRMFFETYTEKVWGTPCSSIAADWAAQRIRGLSPKTIVEQIVRGWFKRPGVEPKTLIAEFEYPRLGPGQMWTTVQRKIEQSGASVHFGSQVDAIHWEPGRVVAFEAGGRQYAGRHFLSSMPVRDLLHALRPSPPEDILRAADDFHYRDFITVALIVRERDLFPDTWIYIHDPAVKVGRIQNYKNWSPAMVPNPETTCLGLEYFCFEGDDLWNTSDQELIERAKRELEYLGLGKAAQVTDGVALRVPKAYPVYDGTYQRGLGVVRRFLETVPNLQLIGRNGMHRYNNQDHSMLTGILAARNLLGLGKHDLWEVNADEEYHEDGFLLSHEETEGLALSQPAMPVPVSGGNCGSDASRKRHLRGVPSQNHYTAGR